MVVVVHSSTARNTDYWDMMIKPSVISRDEGRGRRGNKELKGQRSDRQRVEVDRRSITCVAVNGS
jgi:hypothetical protein